MKLTKEQIQKDLDGLPEHYKTGDVDRLIRDYVKQKADVSALRPYILSEQQFHRIYFYVMLDQIRKVEERMAFIHENLLFSDWWHTDQLIFSVSKLEFDTALGYAKEYVRSKGCPFKVKGRGYDDSGLFLSMATSRAPSPICASMRNSRTYSRLMWTFLKMENTAPMMCRNL